MHESDGTPLPLLAPECRVLVAGEGAAVEAEEQARQLELCKAVAKDRLKAIEISAANDGVRKTRSRKLKA